MCNQHARASYSVLAVLISSRSSKTVRYQMVEVEHLKGPVEPAFASFSPYWSSFSFLAAFIAITPYVFFFPLLVWQACLWLKLVKGWRWSGLACVPQVLLRMHWDVCEVLGHPLLPSALAGWVLCWVALVFVILRTPDGLLHVFLAEEINLWW